MNAPLVFSTLVGAAALCAGTLAPEAPRGPAPTAMTSSPAIAVAAAPGRTSVAPSVAPARPIDAVATYEAMRDETNPVPRLRHLEASARDAPRHIDLLSHAMTDPDDAVRERAQVLFDRSLTTPVLHASADEHGWPPERKIP